VISLRSAATTLACRAGETLNRTFVLPLVFFSPTSRCNSRCVSCDWWKSDGAGDLTLPEVRLVAAALQALSVRLVVFTGGEPLVRREVFEMARAFRARGARLWLLTSGLQLARFAEEIAREFARVTISLDGATRETYRRVRGVDALELVAEGVARLRSIAPAVPITARCTIHRQNHRELERIVRKAREIGVDRVSFLAADLSSSAFNRTGAAPHAADLALDEAERAELRQLIDVAAADLAGEFATRFVEQPPERLRRIADYYDALAGAAPFPPVRCNAPWVSLAIEANGDVRPCFFHAPIGNVRDTPIARLVAHELRAFRARLDVSTNPTCQRCVCSLKVGLRTAPW
jgi:MoaA/NifB/PqqE/SkfB family radical SAM enzyme